MKHLIFLKSLSLNITFFIKDSLEAARLYTAKLSELGDTDDQRERQIEKIEQRKRPASYLNEKFNLKNDMKVILIDFIILTEIYRNEIAHENIIFHFKFKF
jgi:hypothetical protein